jgi:hypothetical protein
LISHFHCGYFDLWFSVADCLFVVCLFVCLFV